MKSVSRRIALILAVLMAFVIIAPIYAEASPITNPQITSPGAVVIDFETGTPLFEQNARDQRVPASMIKMIAVYVVLDAIRDGYATMDTEILISPHVRALSTHPGWSNVALVEGERYTVRELLEIVIVRSANGATVALGEGIFGSDEALVAQMNAKASELNIRAHFADSFGISAQNRISPLALAWFMQSLIVDHPEVLEFSSMRTVTFRDGDPLNNTNHLLTRFDGADGLKTGFTSAAGFCLVGTAVRDGRRLITVTMGNTVETRFPDTEAMLEWGFANADRITRNTPAVRPIERLVSQTPTQIEPPLQLPEEPEQPPSDPITPQEPEEPDVTEPPSELPPELPPQQVPTGRAVPSHASLILDGITMPLSAYLIDGAHYFRLRDIAFLLNGSHRQFEVKWDADGNAIRLYSGQPYTVQGGELIFSITGSRPFRATPSRLYFDNVAHSFTAFLIDGNNFFMLRDLATLIGFEVDWIASTRTVIMNTHAIQTPAA